MSTDPARRIRLGQQRFEIESPVVSEATSCKGGANPGNQPKGRRARTNVVSVVGMLRANPRTEADVHEVKRPGLMQPLEQFGPESCRC